jgi:hypothetical protein
MFRKRFISLTVIVIIGFSAFPTFAWNQLPLLTDSPQVLPAGQVQVDFGLKFLSHKNFPFSPSSKRFSRNVLSFPTLGINFGLGKQVELQLTYEVLFVEEEELTIKETWKSGDLAFFTKLEILEERRHLPGMGIKFGAKLPNANNTYRVGTDETDLAFSALFGKTFSSFALDANLSLLILGDPFNNARQDDLLGYGIAWTIPWKHHITWTLEVAGQVLGTSYNENASAVLHLDFEDGAFTWTITGRAGLLKNSEDWGVSAGVRWTFDGLTRWISGK